MRTLFAAGLLALALALPAHGQTVPLIPRATLFGNPSHAGAQISPDGRWLEWLAPRDGVLNVWAAPVSDPASARPLTAVTSRPIYDVFWAPDSSGLFYLYDSSGDENDKLYSVSVSGGEPRLLTPAENTRAEMDVISPAVRDHILIGLNTRDPQYHDIYSLDVKTGALTLVMQNNGYDGFTADNDLVIRLASKSRDDGGVDYFAVTDGKIAATPLTSVDLDDSLTTAPIGYGDNGRTLYWIDSRGRDTAALEAMDTASGKTDVLAGDARADIGQGLTQPMTGAIEAYTVDYATSDYVPLGDAVAADLAFLKAQDKGQVYVLSRDNAEDKWVVMFDPVTAPASTWLYDRMKKSLTRLYVSRPELEGAPLVPMLPEEIKARDGLTLVSYLTLPPGADRDGDGRADRPSPLVLYVHGGPWGRDEYGYAGGVQWLANRGYAVLQVNFRASTGFGKRFLAAGNLQWGGDMQNDLDDAVDWAVKAGVTTPDKVAIVGGSYGGYATLAGMAFTPGRYACGVDMFGPSNLDTLLASLPPYWEAFRHQFYQRVGDPTTPEGESLLHARSPLFAAAAIRKPLLIGQGANDVRVHMQESDQIVAAMQGGGVPVTYIVFPDEGHGFARPENVMAFNATMENFLANCLGGRAEPIGDAIKASSAEVKAGADFVPGLKP